MASATARSRMILPFTRADTSVGTLHFSGIFNVGPHQGIAFAGRIDVSPHCVPSERHIGMALFDTGATPLVTMLVDGQMLSGSYATVYANVFDGASSHYDLVTLSGDGGDDLPEGAFFELLFASEEAGMLSPSCLPSPAQLAALPVRQVAFGDGQPGGAISRGEIICAAGC